MPQENQNSFTLELSGPQHRRFLVRIFRDGKAEECLLTGAEFAMLLQLCHAFLYGDGTAAADLLDVIGAGRADLVWTTAKRLRRSLKDHHRELVVNDFKTIYHLAVNSVECDGAFRLCRSCFDPAIVAIIDRIIEAIDRLRRHSA